jgi:hypothetical protein
MAEINDSIEVTKVAAPPYISFRTLLNLVERMANEGIPRRIDRSYLGGLSGGYQTQVMAALRGLGLINDEGTVQPRLVELVGQPSERQTLIAAILRERYPEAVRLGAANATQGELEDSFRPFGITGATLRKAVAFYLHAAEFAGIPVSPFFKPPSTSSEGRTTGRRRTRTTAAKTVPAASQPAFPAIDTEQLKTRYIEMLLKRVDEGGELDDKLLNRIETLLGFDGQPEADEREED